MKDFEGLAETIASVEPKKPFGEEIKEAPKGKVDYFPTSDLGLVTYLLSKGSNIFKCERRKRKIGNKYKYHFKLYLHNVDVEEVKGYKHNEVLVNPKHFLRKRDLLKKKLYKNLRKKTLTT